MRRFLPIPFLLLAGCDGNAGREDLKQRVEELEAQVSSLEIEKSNLEAELAEAQSQIANASAAAPATAAPYYLPDQAAPARTEDGQGTADTPDPSDHSAADQAEAAKRAAQDAEAALAH